LLLDYALDERFVHHIDAWLTPCSGMQKVGGESGLVREKTGRSYKDPVDERKIRGTGHKGTNYSYVRVSVCPFDSFNDRERSSATCGSQAHKLCKPRRDTRLYPRGDRITWAHKHHSVGVLSEVGQTHGRGDGRPP